MSLSSRKIFYNKVANKNQTSAIRLKTEWEKNYFQLFVTESMSSWFALVTPGHIQKLAELHNIGFEAYFKNLEEYLSNTTPHLSFEVEGNEFVIYREIENEDLQIRYFYVELEQMNYQSTMETLFDELVANCNDLTQKQDNLKKEYDKAVSEKLLYKSKCSEFIELKHKSDIEMYGSFITLLNEKKMRIQFLTELLEVYESGRKRKFTQQEQMLNEPKASTSKSNETISDSDTHSSEDYNTDDEKKIAKSNVDNDSLDFLGEHSPPPPQLSKRVKNSCSTSKLSIPSASKTKLTVPIEKELNPQQDSMDLNLADDFQEDSDDEMKLSTQELLDRM